MNIITRAGRLAAAALLGFAASLGSVLGGSLGRAPWMRVKLDDDGRGAGKVRGGPRFPEGHHVRDGRGRRGRPGSSKRARRRRRAASASKRRRRA